MAKQLCIPLARWHLIHAPHYGTTKAGRPKGKLKRPKGTLSVRDAMDKFGVTAAELMKWRAEGMPYRTVGVMIVVKETDLKEWIENMGRSA